jgi:hypothetical protein
MEPDESLLRGLVGRRVRFVAIGMWGINLYARTAGELFATRDTDFFLPPDPENLLETWSACEEAGLELLCGSETLDRPRDLFLARAVCERRSLTYASGEKDYRADLTLVMAGFDFESVESEARKFMVHGVEVPVARLTHIVQSKALAGRPKDLMFLSTYREFLDKLRDQPPP